MKRSLYHDSLRRFHYDNTKQSINTTQTIIYVQFCTLGSRPSQTVSLGIFNLDALH